MKGELEQFSQNTEQKARETENKGEILENQKTKLGEWRPRGFVCGGNGEGGC